MAFEVTNKRVTVAGAREAGWPPPNCSRAAARA